MPGALLTSWSTLDREIPFGSILTHICVVAQTDLEEKELKMRMNELSGASDVVGPAAALTSTITRSNKRLISISMKAIYTSHKDF